MSSSYITDPKYAHLTEQQRRELDDLERFSREIYEAVEAETAKKRRMSTTEFTKYAPLYQCPPEGEEMNSRFGEKAGYYAALSNEFLQRIDRHSPLEIYDPATGETVLTLPAPYNEVQPLNRNQIDHMNTFITEGVHQLALYRHNATENFKGAILLSQDITQIRAKQAQTKQLIEEGNQKLGLSGPSETTPTAPTEDQPVEITTFQTELG